jgi:DNA-binding NtrC family response regulator
MTPTARSPYDAWLEDTLVGESLIMRRLRSMIARVGQSAVPVLVRGPTGVGKEVVAQALHRISGRSGSMVAVNICALGDTMFESALFGHVRGAFTGALNDTTGFVTEADRGTLFLDEIGALPLREQAKLLRVLETRTYRPVGAPRDRASDFRLVTATNEDLEDAVESARFRGDLRYRLGTIELRVPALVERRGDIPLLVRHVSGMIARSAAVHIDDAAMATLVAYDWPGNVRELQSVVTTVLFLGDGMCIERSDVLQVLERPQSPIDQTIAVDLEARSTLVQMLEAAVWNTSQVATELGVNRATVYRRMRMLGINVPVKTPQRRAAVHDIPSGELSVTDARRI